jgi:hypothetical protein
MAKARRTITKEERKGRDALMRIHHWVVVVVTKRLFDDGRTTDEVYMLFDKLQRETGRILLLHSMPDWHWVDQGRAADEVYESLTSGGSDG